MFAGAWAHWKIAAEYHLVPDKAYPNIPAQILRQLLFEGARPKVNDVLAGVCDLGNRGVTSALGLSTEKDDMR